MSATFSLPIYIIFLIFLTFHIALVSTQTYETQASSQAYLLNRSYAGSDFFTGWSFFSGTDPTNGYVDYQTSDEARASELFSVTNGSAYIGVDHNAIVEAVNRGRKSVRIESQESWTQGLFVADIKHMPSSACGVWPAFWMLGSGTWPQNGEIDIIEGVNTMSDNLVSLHTSPDCTMVRGPMSGSPNCLNCDGKLNSNSACNANALDTLAIGTGFNSISGGIYAMEWTSTAIQVWFFPRSSIPADIMNGVPDPSSWGIPQTHYQGGAGCDIDGHFADHRLVFNTAFCGDWAGGEWLSDVTCSSRGATCADYVKNNPQDFSEAYWLINSVKVYQLDTTTSQSSLSISPAMEHIATSTQAVMSQGSPMIYAALQNSLPSTSSSSSSFKPQHSHHAIGNSIIFNSTRHHRYQHNGTSLNSTILNITDTNTTLATTIIETLTRPSVMTSTITSTVSRLLPVTKMIPIVDSTDQYIQVNADEDAYTRITRVTTVTISSSGIAKGTAGTKVKRRRREHFRRHLKE